MPVSSRALARATAATAATALLSTAWAAPTHAAIDTDAQPEATWMVDGPVYASVTIGDTVYLGGRFSHATSTDGDSLPRNGLAAFSISTGKPTGWKPGTNGTVWALETDGTSIWAGGEFTKVNGTARERLARLTASTGDLDAKFDVGVDDTVRALELDHGMLFVGGLFSKIGKWKQAHLAKVNATSGAIPRGFDPVVDTNVRAIVAPPSGVGNDVYVAGNFRKVNGTQRSRVALVNGANGSLKPLTFAKPEKATVRALDISDDGSLLYGGVGGSTNSAIAWSTTTGKQVFRHQVVGDVHAVQYHDGTLWMGFAEGALDDPTARVRAVDASNGAPEPDFAPRVNSLWGVRTIAATDAGVVVAGNFTRVAQEVHRYVAFFRSDLAAARSYVGAGATWRYDDRGIATDGWAAPGFDDTGWRSGRGQLGFGDGDETTVIKGGTAEAPVVTSYFRTTFTVDALPSTLTLRLAADDGAVVYLNGVEVLRDNMPDGAVTAETLASRFRTGADEDWLRTFTVDPSLLQVGGNTLAVEVHQAKGGFTDGSFDARLVGR